MKSESHVTELLPVYALGSLDEGEAAYVSEHLAVCRACRAELLAYLDLVGALCLAAPEAQPPARVKQHLMRRVRQSRRGAGAQRRTAWLQGLFGPSRRAAPAWSLASLVLVFALSALSIFLWQRLSRPTQRLRSGMQVVALTPTGAAADATGTLVISADGEYGTLVVDGLAPLDAAHQYQVWLTRDGRRTSGGVFSVNPHGYGVIELMAPEPLASYPAFGVTVEPAGGSPAPTGPNVLSGRL